jgi:hypothetical protein
MIWCVASLETSNLTRHCKPCSSAFTPREDMVITELHLHDKTTFLPHHENFSYKIFELGKSVRVSDWILNLRFLHICDLKPPFFSIYQSKQTYAQASHSRSLNHIPQQ